MAIITISRQAGSLSHEIAPVIAGKIGFFYIGSDEIRSALGKNSIDTSVIDRFDEKKPGFKDSFSLENERYHNYLKLYIYEKALENRGCVLLGRGGAFLLRGIPGVLRIRLVASEKKRVERIMKKFSCDVKEAKKIITASDRERAGFHKYYYHEDWENPCSYDITLNSDDFPADSIANMLEGVINYYIKGNFEEEGRKRLSERLLAQKIVVKTLYEENIPVHLLEVEVRDDHAKLSGTVEIESLIEKCGEIARIEGIKSVDNKIVFISQYPPII